MIICISSVNALSFFHQNKSKDFPIAKFFGNVFLYWKFFIHQFSDFSGSENGLLKAISTSFYNACLNYRILSVFDILNALISKL